MIGANAVTAWGLTHPWPMPEQAEQDLLLSRAICEIANHPDLSDQLVLRGGTAFHKLHLGQALRYSENLDYVRTTSGGIGPLMQTLTSLGDGLGFTVRTRIGEHPKVYWAANAHTGVPIRIKIEINTHERAHARPLDQHRFAVTSPWWDGQADVPTLDPVEMSATKIRALYQRKKGRDLFDLWLGLTRLNLEPAAIISAFATYRPTGYTAKLAIANLETKRNDPAFRTDLEPLVTAWPHDYDIDDATRLVIDNILNNIDT